MTVFVVGLYLVVMLGIGLWATRFIKNKEDFLLAGRRLGLTMGAATLAATMMGGGFIMGGGEWGFTYGLSGVWMGVGCGLAIILIGLLTAERMRTLALYTVPEYLEKRYGSRFMKLLAATLSTIAIIGIVASQITAGKALVAILGVDPTVGAIVVALIFIIYTSASGMWAVTLTDFVQVIVAIAGVVVGSLIILGKVGGLNSFSTQAAQTTLETGRFFSLWGAGGTMIFLFLTGEIAYALIGQEFYQRVFSIKDAKTARMAGIVGGLVLVAFAIFPAFMGMSARILYGSEISDAAMAVPYMIKKLFAPGIKGIFLAAVLAAVMSSADSMLTAGVSHIINDFGLGSDKKFSEKEIVKISMISTAVMGILGLFLALAIPSIVDLLMYSYLFYTGGIVVPVLGGLYWKQATVQGALAAIITGTILVILGTFGGVAFGQLPAEMFAVIGSLVVFVIVSLLSKKHTSKQSETVKG